MFSSPIIAGTPATIQQYNRVRNDAKGASYLSPHEASTPNMTVVIESGYFHDSSGSKVNFGGGTAAIGDVGVYPRYDLISVNSSGTLVTTVGTPSGTPVKPTVPTGDAPVCYVYIRVGGTSIMSEDDTVNHYIEDARTIITAPAQAKVAEVVYFIDQFLYY